MRHVEYTLARTRFDFKEMHCYQAVAHSVRDRLIESFNDTHRAFNKQGTKKVYYLSLVPDWAVPPKRSYQPQP